MLLNASAQQPTSSRWLNPSSFRNCCRAVRASGDLHKMMDAVRSDLIRNLANMTNRWV
jgi:hypothetical protein